jgi:hypothetical protein
MRKEHKRFVGLADFYEHFSDLAAQFQFAAILELTGEKKNINVLLVSVISEDLAAYFIEPLAVVPGVYI